MDTKKIIWTTLLAVFLLACDPEREISFSIENKSSKIISLSLFKDLETIKYKLSETDNITIMQYYAIGGGFSAIADFDSISILLNNGKLFKRIKPDNPYGYIDTDNNIGTDRNIGKDFYNRKYWKFKTVGSDEELTFTINEEDLTLFE